MTPAGILTSPVLGAVIGGITTGTTVAIKTNEHFAEKQTDRFINRLREFNQKFESIVAKKYDNDNIEQNFVSLRNANPREFSNNKKAPSVVCPELKT